MIEGWARRFLVGLFQSSTVLFVGYSHGDTVMKYLARALPVDASAPRYVLANEAERTGEFWQSLGVSPVLYPSESRTDHRALVRGIGGLAKHVSRGVLDWQREITDLARRPPPLGEEEEDLLVEAIGEPARVHFFTNVASDAAWIPWLEERGHLAALFRSGDLSEPEHRIARWLASTFVHSNPDDLFLLINRNDMRLHPVFLHHLVRSVAYLNDAAIDDDSLTRWVSCLVAIVPVGRGAQDLLCLKDRCIQADSDVGLLQLFDAIARYRIKVLPPFSSFDADGGNSQSCSGAEIVLQGDEYSIRDLWTNGLKPRLQSVAEPCLVIATEQLACRHRTYVAWRKADREWDPDSFSRSAIEPHKQDRYRGHLDALIDAARDSLEWLAANGPRVASGWCDQHARSSAPLLRRIAVHTLHERQDLSPAEKLSWLLAQFDLHDVAAHHELFRTLRNLYPHADRDGRERVVQSIQAFRWHDEQDDRADQRAARYKFDWFSWLRYADPECSLLRQAVAGLQGSYPTLTPREHPDFLHWGEVKHGSTSPWSVDELVSIAASDWLDRLLEFQEDDFHGPDRRGLAIAIEAASKREFSWGLDLARALAAAQRWDSDLWPALLNAWREADLSEEQICAALEICGRPELWTGHAGRVANVLLAHLERSGASASDAILEQSSEMAKTMWDQLAEGESPQAYDSWHSLAIGRAPGVLSRFWLVQLSVLTLREQSPAVAARLVEVRQALTTIAQENSASGRQGRAVLANQLHFLLTSEEQWTQCVFVPHFTRSPGTDDFHAVWDGLLTSGQLTPPVAEAMDEAFLDALPHMLRGAVGEWRRERFVIMYTYFLAQFIDDPTQSWIPRFFEHASEEARVVFSQQIGDILGRMDDVRQREIWRRWLGRYWTYRLDGVPESLTERETRHMIGWLPNLKGLFPEAVELAIGMPFQSLGQSSGVVDRIHRAGLLSQYPEAVANLLLYLGKNASPGRQWYKADELMGELHEANLPGCTRKRLRELAASIAAHC